MLRGGQEWENCSEIGGNDEQPGHLQRISTSHRGIARGSGNDSTGMRLLGSNFVEELFANLLCHSKIPFC